MLHLFPYLASTLLPSSGCPTQIQTLRDSFHRLSLMQVLPHSISLHYYTNTILYSPPTIEHRDDILESEQPPRKRLCLSTLGSRYEIRENSTARPTRGRGIDYGFVNTVEAVPEIAPMTVGEVNTKVTELVELHEHDTQDLYALLEDAQDSWSRISLRVDMDSQGVDCLWDRMISMETV
ncbi:hypothetical protein Tco_1245695 [Tanacetum coccineum]